MRDILFILFSFSLIPLIFFVPFNGIIIYNWFSLLNPHQLTWGISKTLHIALIVAVCSIISLTLFSKEKIKIPEGSVFWLLILFMCTTTLSAIFSLSPEHSWFKWELYIKILFFSTFTLLFLNSKVRIHALMWTIAIAIGYYGAKGGIFSIASAGQYLVKGAPSTMIGDRNALALAMIMIIPILNYLYLHSANKKVRIVLFGTLALTFLAVITTYSRGGFLGLIAMSGVLWWHGKNKFRNFLFIAIIGIASLSFMPEKYFDRIKTIKTASTEDASFMGRLDAWRYAWKVALDRPLTGGGITSTEDSRAFLKYVNAKPRAAHSIYFQVLGDQGFVGFFIYLSLIIITWFNGSWIIKRTKGLKGFLWANTLARMFQVSLAGYMVTGAALSMAYYDLFYLIAITAAQLKILVKKEIATQDRLSCATSPLHQSRNPALS